MTAIGLNVSVLGDNTLYQKTKERNCIFNYTCSSYQNLGSSMNFMLFLELYHRFLIVKV